MRIVVSAGLDASGEHESFTWDLLPLVSAGQTRHLQENGLPRVGTRLRRGMIIVGKIGKSPGFDPVRRPSALELHGLGEDELRKRYGHMWTDGSVYADDSSAGVVTAAFFDSSSTGPTAIVEIATEASK